MALIWNNWWNFILSHQQVLLGGASSFCVTWKANYTDMWGKNRKNTEYEDGKGKQAWQQAPASAVRRWSVPLKCSLHPIGITKDSHIFPLHMPLVHDLSPEFCGSCFQLVMVPFRLNSGFLLSWDGYEFRSCRSRTQFSFWSQLQVVSPCLRWLLKQVQLLSHDKHK